mmetsp:Transcript_26683/g.41418  ORF Transcript_26683/g.41418 Transcript_26683/m.41418 type:complete len:315 (-) Transcript_26683:58-1002(-)
MNAIDFRALLRQEKAAARRGPSRKNKGSHDDDFFPGVQQQPRHQPNGLTFVYQGMEKGSEDNILCEEVLPESSTFPTLSSQHILTLPKTNDDKEVTSISIPPTISYISNFLPPENNFYQHLYQIFLRDKSIPIDWIALKHAKRRVALFDAKEHPLPRWLKVLCDALVSTAVFDQSHRPNHVLINLYNAGEGIMPHTDGPEYFSKTATLSIGGSVLLKFSPRLSASEIGVKTSGTICEVLLEGGSLVIFEGEAYSGHMHGIDECLHEIASPMKCVNLRMLCAKKSSNPTASSGVDEMLHEVYRSERVSLTFRHKK